MGFSFSVSKSPVCQLLRTDVYSDYVQVHHIFSLSSSYIIKILKALLVTAPSNESAGSYCSKWLYQTSKCKNSKPQIISYLNEYLQLTKIFVILLSGDVKVPGTLQVSAKAQQRET